MSSTPATATPVNATNDEIHSFDTAKGAADTLYNAPLNGTTATAVPTGYTKYDAENHAKTSLRGEGTTKRKAGVIDVITETGKTAATNTRRPTRTAARRAAEGAARGAAEPGGATTAPDARRPHARATATPTATETATPGAASGGEGGG